MTHKNKTLYKCWITFIEPYILVSYRTVGMLHLNVLLSLNILVSYRTIGMLHDTWYYKQGNGRYDSLEGRMQSQVTQMTRWIHTQ